MLTTSVSELRSSLPHYLSQIQKGEHITITSHGKAIARIVPLIDAAKEAQLALKQLRKTCKIGDVVSPIEDQWDSSK
jgi:prevent-host-death family protein